MVGHLKRYFPHRKIGTTVTLNDGELFFEVVKAGRIMGKKNFKLLVWSRDFDCRKSLMKVNGRKKRLVLKHSLKSQVQQQLLRSGRDMTLTRTTVVFQA